MVRSLLLVAVSLVSAACASSPEGGVAGSDSPPAETSYSQSPNPTVRPSAAEGIALAAAATYALRHYSGSGVALGNAAAAAIAAYFVFDPLAANWTIEERMLDSSTFLLSMRAKSFRTGGDGESGLILRRRASQLQRERGSCAFRIGDYSEGIESSTPFTHRYAEGVIHLLNKPPCNAAKLGG
ncbi:MAG: hypothetical protein RKP46_17880 [Candidatus Accumulibacter sp.]|uniref:hypothetical protein n=1 Tax=Accumulibacter sp. TaxID=2053492 RepID=UPI002878F5F1|nr:hypothetical protein [Accumulibacter sp.]MDS4016203.1 hypothetical protein [Accumulibacter sp.]